MTELRLVPPLPPTDVFALGHTELAGLASERILRRGLGYARAGRVLELSEADGRLEGKVSGSEAEPYRVVIAHDGEELQASCSCPFDWEPLCKHAVAVLAVRNQLHVLAPGADRAGSPSELPTLEGAGDPTAGPPALTVEERELEVRRRRAAKEGFKVRPVQCECYLGRYEVESPSGRVYAVELRSLTERFNRCSCQDFAHAMLGSCKHIEAVLAARRSRSLRTFERYAARPLKRGQLLVDQADTPRLRLRLPVTPSPELLALAREFFDGEGVFRGDPVEGFAELLLRADGVPDLEVHEDAVAWSRQAAQERQAARRSEEVRQAVRAAGVSIPGIRVPLYPYQVEGAAFLAARGRALLGDDMGLGKTIQAIAAARLLWDRGEVRRALIVCPASLKHQWASELQRFGSLPCTVVEGNVPARLAAYRTAAPFTIVNYELVLRDHRAITELAPDLIVLDEAQRLRNWRTQTAEAVKSLRSRFAFVLSGTPLQNRLDDLYSVMQVVDRRVLGPLWAYNERFVQREPDSGRILGYGNLGELRRRLAPVLLRREKEEVSIQLPERIVSRLGLPLTEAQRELMLGAVAEVTRLAAIAERRPLSPAEETKMMIFMQQARMACNAAGLVDKETVGSPKLDEFEQLAAELCLERGRKAVVFSEWERFGAMAAQRAEKLGLGYVRLHGAVRSDRRGELIDRFRDDPDCKLFFATDAGGVGLNLQFASTLINLELPWNPAVLDQRIGRVHRHGQREPVHVLLLVSEDSFETGIEQALRGKRSLFGAALSSRAEVEEVSAPTSCLATVRAALLALDDEDDEESVGPELLEPGAGEGEPGDEQGGDGELGAGDEDEGADEGAEQPEPPESPESPRSPGSPDSPEPPEPVRQLAATLGSRLVQVVALPSGRLVAVVDRQDELTRTAAGQAGLALTDAAGVQALAGLGHDSPFSGAKVLFDHAAAGAAGPGDPRRERLAVGRRRLEAARKLAAAELPAEAIGQAHAAMLAALHGLALQAGDGAALPPTRLLFEVLVPRQLLTFEQASQVLRAEGLARAYADSTVPVPPGLLQAVLADAEALLGAGA